ncbi:hypothetical protein HYALB_00008604 [Hymenoscyphus albidus]|uniref:Uncharacterized protein n=1 Tax=Hymenoscyphus albidus TaxID=595503 RepID=A0A9N9LEM7_9HELO|nr:hypothetical protein HYALB_00008604 [Hymenoscyphus albidus]
MRLQNLICFAALAMHAHAATTFKYITAQCRIDKTPNEEATKKACLNYVFNGCPNCKYTPDPDGTPFCKSSGTDIVPEFWDTSCKTYGATRGVGG